MQAYSHPILTFSKLVNLLLRRPLPEQATISGKGSPWLLMLSPSCELWVQYGHRAQREQIRAPCWLTEPPPPHYPISARLSRLPRTTRHPCLSYLFPNSPYELLKYSVLLESYLTPLILRDDLDSHFAYLKREIINRDPPSALCFACRPAPADTAILNLKRGSQRTFAFSSLRSNYNHLFIYLLSGMVCCLREITVLLILNHNWPSIMHRL